MEGEKYQNLAFADHLSTHIFRPQALFSIPNVLLGDTPLLSFWGTLHFCPFGGHSTFDVESLQ